MNRIIFIILFIGGVQASLSAQKQVSFLAEDSLRVTADLYLKDIDLPFILLFHQASSSRGEYLEIAKKLQKLDYNVLAVDLREGGKSNYITNETALAAKQANSSRSPLDAQKDVKASLNFVKKYNPQKPVLLGSSYSASLCLIEANQNRDIKAVVAMSPGEYFRPDLIVKDNLENIALPLFISAAFEESKYVKELLASVDGTRVKFFEARDGEGDHGAKMLWKSCKASDECWLELLLFFKMIRY